MLYRYFLLSGLAFPQELKQQEQIKDLEHKVKTLQNMVDNSKEAGKLATR